MIWIEGSSVEGWPGADRSGNSCAEVSWACTRAGKKRPAATQAVRNRHSDRAMLRKGRRVTDRFKREPHGVLGLQGRGTERCAGH